MRNSNQLLKSERERYNNTAHDPDRPDAQFKNAARGLQGSTLRSLQRKDERQQSLQTVMLRNRSAGFPSRSAIICIAPVCAVAACC